MKTLSINGESITTDKATVLELLQSLEMVQGRFAVEIDGLLVPKVHLAQTLLADGMKIEVVQAVGGG